MVRGLSCGLLAKFPGVFHASLGQSARLRDVKKPRVDLGFSCFNDISCGLCWLAASCAAFVTVEFHADL